MHKAIQIILESSGKTVISGTNCGNCRFFTGKKESIKPDELNEQGGVKAPDKDHLDMAKEADLITLPGKDNPTEKVYCVNKDIKQFVTSHMCCAYWDNPGVYREFKK